MWKARRPQPASRHSLKNDVFVVPEGVEHCPRADEEVHAILFEPKGTVNTGDAGGELTAKLREFD